MKRLIKKADNYSDILRQNDEIVTNLLNQCIESYLTNEGFYDKFKTFTFVEKKIDTNSLTSEEMKKLYLSKNITAYSFLEYIQFEDVFKSISKTPDVIDYLDNKIKNTIANKKIEGFILKADKYSSILEQTDITPYLQQYHDYLTNNYNINLYLKENNLSKEEFDWGGYLQSKVDLNDLWEVIQDNINFGTKDNKYLPLTEDVKEFLQQKMLNFGG